MTGAGSADADLHHPWLALLASVGTTLAAWLLLTGISIALASCLPDASAPRPRPMLEIRSPRPPLWLRLDLFACGALWLTRRGRMGRMFRLGKLRVVLVGLGTCLLLALAFYHLEHLDWRLAFCGFWAVVVAAFAERPLRRRYRMLARRPGTAG